MVIWLFVIDNLYLHFTPFSVYVYCLRHMYGTGVTEIGVRSKGGRWLLPFCCVLYSMRSVLHIHPPLDLEFGIILISCWYFYLGTPYFRRMLYLLSTEYNLLKRLDGSSFAFWNAL